MFNVHVLNAGEKIPEDDVCYIVGKEGIFLKKKLGIMESISPVENISVLESVETTAKMHIKKMPSILVAKISNFFKSVEEKYQAEAIVLLFYNENTEKYKIHVPSQKVSGASLEYSRSITIEGFIMIGTIHSHSSMSAFHSGIDQGDEKSFDGLHITFGNINSENISISCSIVSNGHRTMCKPSDYMNGIKLVSEIDEVKSYPTTKVFKYINGKLVEQESVNKYRHYDKRYQILSENNIKAKCPDRWMNKVEKKTYAYTYSGYGGGKFVNGVWTPNNNKWGNHYNSHWWDEIKNKKQPPQNVGVKVKPIEFPPHSQDKKDKPYIVNVTETSIPCRTCAFKERAFDFVSEELEGSSINLYDNENEDIVYLCEKCNITIMDEDLDNDVCPMCKSGDHLVMIEDLEDIDDEDEISESHMDSRNNIKCTTCSSSFGIELLIDDENGGNCPFCGTLLIPNQELNYIKIEENKYKCNNCLSEFTKGLIKNSQCPLCKTSLLNIPDLLGENSNKIEQISKEEINNYQAAKNNPDPSTMITQPKKHHALEIIRDTWNKITGEK